MGSYLQGLLCNNLMLILGIFSIFIWSGGPLNWYICYFLGSYKRKPKDGRKIATFPLLYIFGSHKGKLGDGRKFDIITLPLLLYIFGSLLQGKLKYVWRTDFSNFPPLFFFMLYFSAQYLEGIQKTDREPTFYLCHLSSPTSCTSSVLAQSKPKDRPTSQLRQASSPHSCSSSGSHIEENQKTDGKLPIQLSHFSFPSYLLPRFSQEGNQTREGRLTFLLIKLISRTRQIQEMDVESTFQLCHLLSPSSCTSLALTQEKPKERQRTDISTLPCLVSVIFYFL